ncbi:MAG: M24 family metallopeptidase [Candidatus Anstonellaceae archaeon]
MRYPILLFNFEKEPNPNFYYYTSLNLDGCAVLFLKNKKILFSSLLNKYKLKEFSKEFEVKLIDKKSFSSELKKYIYKKKIGLDLDFLSATKFLILKKKFKIKPLNISKFFSKLRMKKSEKEIAYIKKAATISKKILREITPEIKKGMSEIQLANLLKKKALDYNAALAFEPIVAADSSSKNPHHTPTNKKIKRFCLIDFGVKYKNYCSDISRCFFLTKNSKEEKYYNIAKKIFRELVGELKVSPTTSIFYKKTYKILKKYGWENIPHSIGHGIGLEVHEPPFFSKNSNYSLNSTVIALEPAYYCKDFGVRFEEDIAITKNKKVQIL